MTHLNLTPSVVEAETPEEFGASVRVLPRKVKFDLVGPSDHKRVTLVMTGSAAQILADIETFEVAMWKAREQLELEVLYASYDSDSGDQ